MQRMERQGIICIFTGTGKFKEWKYKKRRDRKMQGTDELIESRRTCREDTVEQAEASMPTSSKH